VPDSEGYGEGQTYLGSATVTTDPSGFASFDETFTAYSSWGDVITATATDADGNTSEFSEAIGGTLSQILADVNQPFYYKVNETGHPNIFDGSDTAAISSAFKTWTDVETADIEFINAGTTPDKYASAIDGVNLVSFVDDQYPFPPGVLAMAAKTLKVEPGDNVAEIIDADIIFNPVYLNHPIYKIGVGEDVFDIQSIATHEIGHVLGLIHSGNPLATMFFMLDKGTEAQSLETDDKTWVSYRYPTPDYDLNFGTISGNITYGYNGDAVAGALVLATNTDPGTNESIHAYSDATGHYEVPVPPGTYNITIEPLDGDVEGYPLLPRNISVYVYANTVYTDYPKEYYNEGDTDGHLDNNEIPTDDESMVSSVTVSAGGVVSGKDLITNLDLIPPTVESVIPASDATGVDITQILKITFSEPVDENTLKDNTCYLTSDNGNIISTGSFKGEGGNSEIILFIPDESMSCQTLYTLHIAGGEAGVADLKGNELVEDYTSSFTTKSKDTDNPEVKSTIPENEAVDVYVISNVEIFFSEPMDKNTVEDGFVLSWLDEDSGSENNVEGSFEWDKNNSVMKFVPLSTFLEGEDYTISLPTSAKDLSGNSLAEALSSSFTTVGQAPPEIKYLGPDGTIPVTVTTPVVVDFSEPINPASVKYSTFKLLYGNQQVPGYYKFLNDNSRVVFVPDDDLLFNEVYTIIITDGIKDVSRPVQNKEDITTSVFTTADKVLTPHLEYIEPVSGVTGSLITVTGTGFDPSPENNVVIFNGIESNVIKSSLTSLVVKVPLGAISGPVSTKVNEVSSTNSKHFYVIPESLDPCDEGIANISTGSKSRDADIDPDGSMAYVTNPDAGTVSVIDMEEEEEVYEIQVGKEPMKIDIDPSGTRAYVTNFYSHTVSVIDLTSTPKQVIKTIPVGVNPYGVIVTPDGKRVYVANYTSENLSVIDVDPTSGGFDHVVSNINSGTQNRDEGMTGDGALLLVTGNDGLKIISSDPADLDYNTVIVNSSSGTRTHDVGVEGDAGIAFVTTEDGNILIIDINRGDDSFGAVLANQKSGSRGGDIEMSGDGLFIYVTDSDADQVLVYKIAYGGSEQNASYYTIPTLTLHNTIHVGDHPEGLVIDADNQQLLVVNSGAETAEASLQVIRICCGPIEPDVAIGELIITVQTIINYGIIDEPIGNDLINWLNAALDYWFKGDNKKAINRLNTFIRKVGDLVKGHRITKDQGQPLIDAATLIIDMLKAKGEITVNVETPVFDSGHPGTGPVTESTIGLIYPNPSTGSFTANYAVANDNEFNKVTIRVYDNNGKPVTTLVDRYMETGRYTVDWDGNFENGSPAPGGTYFVHFRAGDVETVRMIILIR
jgi:YVTN family beta-propeller protein